MASFTSAYGSDFMAEAELDNELLNLPWEKLGNSVAAVLKG